MPILERGLVLLELSRLLHEAGDGHGRLVFLGGEAGIGKTVLLRRFQELVERSARTVHGACDPLSTPRPLAPFLEVAAQLDRHRWPDLPAGPAGRDPFFRDFLASLSGPQPFLIILEDVHWADEATLDLLRYLGRRVGDRPALVLATYRSEETGDRHPLRVVLGDLATSPAVSRMQLEPLSIEAVRALAAGSRVDARELHRQTSGNPFFVTEVLAAPGDGIPPTVRDAVLARASRLPRDARDLLDVAAVIGSRSELWLLEAIAEPLSPALDACVSSGMLRSFGATLHFRHELAREAILEAIPPSRSRALHRAALGALASSATGARELARLASHAEGAHDTEAVLEYARKAGRIAAELGVHREAAAQFGRALRFAAGLEPVERAELLERYSAECGSTNRFAEAIEADRELVAIWRSLGNRLKEGWSLDSVSRSLVSLGRNREAEAASREAIEVLETLPAGEELATAYAGQAGLRMLNRDCDEAIEWARKALAIAEPGGYLEATITSYNRLGAALLILGDARGRQYLERSRDLAQEAGMHRYVALAYVNLGSSAGELFDLPTAIRYLEDGIIYAEAHQLEGTLHYMTGWLALARLYLGEWSVAEECARAAIARARGDGIGKMVALTALGRVLSRRGHAEGVAVLDELLRIASPTETLQRVGPARTARAESAWLAGDPERARREARAGLPLAVEHRHGWLAGELLCWLAMSGESVTAPDWIARPYALQLAGDWSGAAAEWQRLQAPYEAALALAHSGDAESIRTARATFEELGAAPAVRFATRRLRSIGIRQIPRGPRPSTRRNPGQLTPREIDVVRLLSEGLQNVQIARRLFLSPKTVDHHVSSVLGKLGVRSRTEAARAARKLGIVDDPVSDGEASKRFGIIEKPGAG